MSLKSSFIKEKKDVMAVKTFCELETRFKCKIEVDIQNIDQHYKVDENQLYLSKSSAISKKILVTEVLPFVLDQSCIYIEWQCLAPFSDVIVTNSNFMWLIHTTY